MCEVSKAYVVLARTADSTKQTPKELDVYLKDGRFLARWSTMRKASIPKPWNKETSNHSPNLHASVLRRQFSSRRKEPLGRRRRVLDGTSGKLISAKRVAANHKSQSPHRACLGVSTALLFIANTIINRFLLVFRMAWTAELG